MKTVITRILLWATLLTTVFCLLPTQTQAAQPGQLEDYVDPAAFSAYLKEAFYDLAENTPYLSDTIDLRQYQIPATDALWEETTRAAVLALPELNLVGHYYIYDDGTYLSSLSISFYSGLKDPVYFEAIERAGNGLLYGVEDSTVLSEAERALILHDRLAVWTAYDYENYLNDTVPGISYTGYGALVERVAVCSGYADAYGYLLARAGIYSYTTTSASLDHEWNIVYIDGIPYHADVTWDDPTPDLLGRVSHKNFLRSTQGMLQTGHGADDYDTTPTDTTYDTAYWQNSEAAFQVIEDRLYYLRRSSGEICEVVDGRQTVICSADQFGRLSCIRDRLLFAHGTSLYYWDFELQEDRFVLDMVAELGWSYSPNGWIYEKGQIIVSYSYLDPDTNTYEYITKAYPYELPADTGWQSDPFGFFFYDENRQRVKNVWLQDDVDWRFLGADGYVVYNQWCQDSSGRFYANREGYRGREQWAPDGYEQCWLDAQGIPVRSQWHTYQGELYYLDANGFMVRNQWLEDMGGLRYMNYDGISVHDGWFGIGDDLYYFTPDGYRYSGKLDNGAFWHWFDLDGKLVKDRWFQDETGQFAYANHLGTVYPNRWYSYDGVAYTHCGEPNYDLTEANLTYYYLDDSGHRFSGWLESFDQWHYFDENGCHFYNGWLNLPQGKYYIDREGHRVIDCWIYENAGVTQFYSHSTADLYGGKLYYLDPDGKLSIGWKQRYDGWYFFDENGVKVKDRWIRDSVGWCYLNNIGLMVSNNWVADSVGMCYLDANGRMKTNAWILHNGYWYYVNGSGYRLYGWQQIGGKWYYFKPNGTMVDSCWIYKDANGYTPYSGFSKMTLSKYPHYLIDANGAMATGWRKVDGNWFYFDNSGLMVKEKWAKDSVGWCYLDRYGIMLTNCWKQDSKGWCYIGESGYILTNKWLQQSGTWYYLDSAGYRAAGWKQLGGKWYYFYSSGAMATSTYMDGGWIDGNGVWRAS